MFERTHHQLVAQVLTLLDGTYLSSQNCLFGRGTAIALSHGEYRESVDMDFIVSDVPSYRGLRLKTAGENGVLSLMSGRQELVSQLKPVRADQYGIRTTLVVQKQPIKFEIVLEGRIRLDEPEDGNRICGVTRLSARDLVATKLLANSDRQADQGVFQRDIIDLAMMSPPRKVLVEGRAKAEEAYGEAIGADVLKAIHALEEREGWLDRCLLQLQIQIPKAIVWSHLRDLRKRFSAV